MAKEILTRIQLRHDSWAAWNNASVAGQGANLVLKAGELGICTIAADTNAGQSTSEPVVLFKVGDGTKTFSELTWTSAKAADVYGWAKQTGAQFVDNFLSMVGADGTTMQAKLDGIFATDAALTEAVQNIEKKIADLSVAALEGRVKALEDTVGDYGDIVTHNAAEFAPADIDTGVHAVSLASGTNNGTVKLTVDGTVTDNVAVTGLGDAAYTTVAALNATAKGYADAVEAKIPTEVGVMSVAAGDDTVVLGGDAKNVTVKVNSAKFDAAGAAAAVAEDLAEYENAHAGDYTNDEIDGFVAAVKKYADDNDDDTTYTLVYESKTADHGARLVLTPSEGEAQYVDATPFIKDGMLDNVSYDADTNTLTFTFNTDAGKEAVTVTLTDILAPYVGSTGARVTVTVTDGTIGADLVAGSISKDYLDAGVKASLALADSALQDHQDISHLATEEDLTLAEGRIKALEDAPAAGITAENITAWNGEIGAKALAETKTTTAEVKTQIEAYGYATTDYADQAESDAKAYADELNEAMDGRVQTLENAGYATTGQVATAKQEAIDAAATAAAGLYETKGTAQGLIDGLNLATTYRKVADKITSDDLSDEIFVFNCGTASTVI